MTDGGAPELRRLLAESRDAWLRGDGIGTWRALDAAESIAGGDAALMSEVAAARGVACLKAERYSQAHEYARTCLRLAGRVERPDGWLREAIAYAGVTLGTLDPDAGPSGEEAAAALARLDEIAADPAPELSGPIGSAISNALMLRLATIDDRLDEGPVEAQAWIWVGRARALTEGRRNPGTVVRQAIDLAFRTGQWARAWDYAHTLIDADTQRNELVSVLAKAALLAWEAGMLPEARDLGLRALRASAAVDLPWVRLYSYLGGVIAAAAGGGSLPAALRAYVGCTDAAGHASRPNRAWLAAQVALEAGHSPAAVQAFLDRVAPGGLRYPWLICLSRTVLAAADGRDADRVDPEEFDVRRLTAPDRARLLLAQAGSAVRRDHRSAAVLHLQRARQTLRFWPGRVLDEIETTIAALAATPAVTPAQQRVLDLIVEGRSNDEIAAELGSSARTVAVHVSALLHGTGARSRTDLAIRELRRRLVTGGQG